MSIFIGGNEIQDLYAGTVPVNEVWYGGNLIWQRVTIVYQALAGDITPAVAAEWGTGPDVTISGNNSAFLAVRISDLLNDPKVWLDLNPYCTPGTQYQIDFDFEIFQGNSWQWGTAQSTTDNNFTDLGNLLTNVGSADSLVFTHNSTTTRYLKLRGVLGFNQLDALNFWDVIIRTA